MIYTFEDELGKGTGAPYLMIKNKIINPSPLVDQILLKHMTTRQYYEQFENKRHHYYYSILNEYPHKDYIIPQLISYFEKITDDRDEEEHLFGIIAVLVHKNLYSQRKLYEKFDLFYIRDANYQLPFGLGILIELDRLDAVAHVAQLIGQHAKKISDSQPFYYYYDDVLNMTQEEITQYLKQKNHPDIQRFLSFFQKSDSNKEPAKLLTLDEVKNNITSIAYRGFRIKNWLKTASQKEIEEISQLFLETSNTQIKKNILYQFSKRKIHLPIEILMKEYKKTRNISYKETLINAMMAFQDPKLKDFIKKQFHYESDLMFDYIQVLIRFYEEEDYGEVINFFSDFEIHDIHNMIHFVIEQPLLKKHKIYSEILTILYSKNRCSICRKDIVIEMASQNLIDKNLYQELLHDCNPEITQFIQNLQLEQSD